MRVLTAGRRRGHGARGELAFGTALGANQPGPPLAFGALRQAEESQHQRATGRVRGEMTLGQACPPEYWRAQCAFKDSMVR